MLFFFVFFLSLELGPTSVVSVIWHPGINQLIAGQADGNISIVYDNELSVRGVKLSLAKSFKNSSKIGDYSSIG